MRKSKPKAAPDQSREILTREQLMAWLQVSHGTLNKLMKAEGLPFFNVGKKVLFFKDDVVAYLKNRTVKKSSPRQPR